MAQSKDHPDELHPPLAPRRPHELSAHGDVRVDDWWWLRDRSDPEVIAYLEEENRYADEVLARSQGLCDALFDGIKNRVQEDDVSAPSFRNGWWYWGATTEGEQYAKHCRLEDRDRSLSSQEVLQMAQVGTHQVLLDENDLARGHDYFALGVFDINDAQDLYAYATDTDGSELYTLRFRNASTGEDLDDVIEDVYYGSAWSSDGGTFFYVRPDDAMRPFQVWAHVLGEAPTEDRLVFEETDDRYFLSVARTRSRRYVIIESGSKMTSESRYLDASTPDVEPQVIWPRREGVEYDVDHAVMHTRGEFWLVRSNLALSDGTPATNFALYAVPVGEREVADVVIAHRSDVKLESVDVFATYAVIAERSGGLERLRVHRFDDGDEHVIDQPDPVYSLSAGANFNWDETVYRFGYTSLVVPISTVDYDIESRSRQTVKIQPVLGGYAAEDYVSERLWARASDGTEVPISLVYRRDVVLDHSAPCVLYGYGSYEINIDPTFSIARLNLLERGVVFAIAHIRGGGEMGRIWHEQGRLEHKANTFSDFISCAEYLIEGGYTSSDRLVIRGGSAGGLLVGAVVNMRPELFAAAVAEVPFVDVVTTMSDESLPLTVTEWEEWGNPVGDPVAYETMLSYSPYDNVAAVAYPSMYVTAGLNDPRVGFWEPAKWVARMRATTTGNKPILLRVEMGAGHGGPSGRYDAWRDEARVQAFILEAVGIST